jgi:signal transduction histidine kinase
MDRGTRSISVGRRLTYLVAAEITTALALLILAWVALQKLAADSQFMHRFIHMPVQEINLALDDVARMGKEPSDPARERLLLGRVDEVVKHYRATFQVAGNPAPDAQRQRAELSRLGRLDLVDDERRSVATVEQVVARLSAEADRGGFSASDVEALRLDLRDLLRINLEFVDVAQAEIATNAARTSTMLVSVGLVGIALAGALGWRVRGAIAPRISALVRKVRKFTEYGINERAHIEGHDDIAVLGNALDVGFAAIAERNRERERFLAVAAHELKTPMVSILGFIQAALENPGERERALNVIRRQTKRLSHLVEDLLWAASVRGAQLPFHPLSIDISTIVRHLAEEIEEIVPSHPITVLGPSNVLMLADEGLVTHALWSMLSYAGLLSAPDEPIELAVEPTDARVQVKLQVHGSPLPPEDLMRVFEPFSTLQFEGDHRPRSAVGLFLCREIARVHGGTLLVGEQPGIGPVLTLDLPG